MKINRRGLWSVVAITAISLTITLGGNAVISNAYAEDDSTTTTETNRMSEMSETEHKAMTDHSSAESSKQAAQAAHAAAEAAAKERRTENKEKLSAAKLKVCENRKTNINSRTARIADRGTKHLALFTSIAERAQAFYVKKGITLTNYDALVAEVEAKKAAAQTAVEAIAANKATFTCEGNDPKLAVVEFKANLTLRNTALKEYQTAVKNLIVGIKSVNSTSAPATDKKQTSEEAR